MPYIKQKRRNELDESINQLCVDLSIPDPTYDSEGNVVKVDYKTNVGDLNYAISKLLALICKQNLSYSKINDIMGVLSCVQAEFYRKVAVPYEEIKIKENGDI